MRRGTRLLVPLIGLCLGTAAAAEPIRTPLWGEPALQMDAPTGWRVTRGGWLIGQHFVIAVMPDREGLLAINMAHFDGDPPPLRDMAKKVAGAEWSLEPDSTPAAIDGHPGEAFLATERKAATHPDRQARYVIAKIGEHDLALVIAVVATAESDADRKATDDAIATVHVVLVPTPRG